MRLRYLETDDAIEYEDEEFSKCRAVKLYYVIYSRTAWHSTKISRYSEGCMKPTIDLAKEAAENMRVQGSVFYISEIPALQFINSKRSVFITEINSETPLQYFKEISDTTKLTLLDIFNHFTPSKPNSVIRLIWRNRHRGAIERHPELDHNNIEGLPVYKELLQYKSFSNGKAYYLGWKKIEHRMSSSAIQSLASQFNSIIQAKSHESLKPNLVQF